jgi:hypothetical protein
MPARPPKPIRQQLAESEAMLNARDQANQTPESVRTAFLARRQSIGGVFIEPFSLGLLWLFEELKHPLHTPRHVLDDKGQAIPVLGEGGQQLEVNGQKIFQTEPLSFRDIARAIYIFHDSEAADEALADGEGNFDREAFALAKGIDASKISVILGLITKTLKEGLATVPGGGAANPPRTAS